MKVIDPTDLKSFLRIIGYRDFYICNGCGVAYDSLSRAPETRCEYCREEDWMTVTGRPRFKKDMPTKRLLFIELKEELK